MHSDSYWSIDKKVPIALLVGLMMQAAGAFWWGSNISSRVNVLEKTADLVGPQGDRLTRVEVKLDTVQDGISEIKRLIQQKPSR